MRGPLFHFLRALGKRHRAILSEQHVAVLLSFHWEEVGFSLLNERAVPEMQLHRVRVRD